MTYKDVFDFLSGITVTTTTTDTIPVAYYAFPEDPSNPAPPPPFMVYYYEGSDDLYAGNTNYQKVRPLTIELYTDNKSFDLEERVEDALAGAGLTYSRSETYIDSEKLYMVAYATEIIVTEVTQ